METLIFSHFALYHCQEHFSKQNFQEELSKQLEKRVAPIIAYDVSKQVSSDLSEHIEKQIDERFDKHIEKQIDEQFDRQLDRHLNELYSGIHWQSRRATEELKEELHNMLCPEPPEPLRGAAWWKDKRELIIAMTLLIVISCVAMFFAANTHDDTILLVTYSGISVIAQLGISLITDWIKGRVKVYKR